MPNLSDYGDPTKYNSRNAQLLAAQQDQKHAAALLSNSSAAVRADQTRYNDPNYTPVVNTGPNGTSQTEKAYGGITNNTASLDALKTQAAGNPTQAQQLQNVQNTYSNQASGFNTLFDTSTGGTQVAGQGQLEQGAIDRLRKAGKTDSEITSILSSPEYKSSLQAAMSNTGLQSTDRKDAVLTTAEAQRVLATSRDPKQRAAAQQSLDNQIKGVKGYVPQTSTDQNGITRTTYSEDPNATAMAQQKEKERLAIEEQNRLKAQESSDKLKKFVAGIDTSALQKTKAQIDQLSASIQNLTPELQSAVLPQLLQIQQNNADIEKQVNEIIGGQKTNEEIVAEYGTMEKYIQDTDEKYKAILEKNLATSKEIAEYNRDALKIDKQMIEHDAAVSEQKQMIANVEGEKKLRRQLNRLGIETDVSGLQYLQSEVQKGIDALENLKTGNNLNILKAQLAISEGYRLEVKQAMEVYEAKYLDISSQTTEKLNTIKNSISNAKSERDKQILEARKWGLEQKNANDKEARATISRAYETMIASTDRAKAQQAQDDRQDARLRVQEANLDRRLRIQESNADRRYMEQQADNERSERSKVLQSFRTAEDQPEIKNYVTIRDAYNKAKETFDAATAGGKKLDIAVAKEIATVLHEKSLDPTSVVREGEYLRSSKGQGWVDNVKLTAAAIMNGDTTGITTDSISAFIEAMERSTNVQKSAALGRMSQALNQLQDFNRESKYLSLDPRSAIPIPELLRAEDLSAWEEDQAGTSGQTYDFNYSTYNSDIKNDTYEEDPKVSGPLSQSMPETGLTMDQIMGNWDGLQLMSSPASVKVQQGTGSVGDIAQQFGAITQGFDTPVSTANYKAGTVKAWGGKHNGLDIAMAKGSFVPSLTDGVLESVQYNKGGWGLTAIVRAPDGAEIRYSHLSSLDPMLKIGDQIPKGRELAQVGNTGNVFSTSGGDGTHLDLRIKKDGKYINPFSYTA